MPATCAAKDSRDHVLTETAGAENEFIPPNISKVFRGVVLMEDHGDGGGRLVTQLGDPTAGEIHRFLEERRLPRWPDSSEQPGNSLDSPSDMLPASGSRIVIPSVLPQGSSRVRRYHAIACLSLVLASGCASEPAPAPEPATTRLLSSNGVRAAIEAVQPQIEATLGIRLSAEFSTATGLKRKIDGGEPFDVAILTPPLIDDLVSQGKAMAEGRVDIARVGVGVGAPAAAPRSDVSTPEALKKTILDAKMVAYTAEGQSRATVDKALAQLGLTETVAAKSMVTGPGEGPGAVAAGKADLVMTLISEILVPGVQLLGPFPPEMQNYIVFTAARSPQTKNAESAAALLRFLAGPEVAEALKTHALEPMTK